MSHLYEIEWLSDIDEEIAILFHKKFINEKINDETIHIALEYVRFVIDAYEELGLALIEMDWDE